MEFKELIDIVLTEANGKNAWEWVARIAHHNRVQGSTDYHNIAQIIINELISYGFEDIELFKSPADGKTKTWNWVPSYQWEIKSGELWVVEPEKEKLCDFNKIPMSIITHSKSCDVVAEVVDVGKGITKEDYENKDVKGKIILMSSLLYFSYKKVEESGAIGVIYYPDLERAGDQPDKYIYNGLFTTQDRLDKALFGFSISYRQAMHLKQLMNKGSVKLHAKVDAELLDGNYEVLSAPIYGSEHPEEEIIVMAHLCHPTPSANDNASGSACILEIARTFKSLIDHKLIEAPKRTIRFLWVPEFYGTVPWVKKHEQKIKNAIASLNLDMVGEHRLKIGYPLMIYTSPYSTPSILNDLIKYFVQQIADHSKGIAINGTNAPMSFRMKAFDGGSDHTVFNDSYFAVPSVMLNHDDPYYHSSMDTVEYCDSSELKRVIGISACTSYFLATFDERLLNFAWPLIHKGINERLSISIQLLETLLIDILNNNEKENNQKIDQKIVLAYDILNASHMYEMNLIKSIHRFGANLDNNLFIKSVIDELNLWLSYQTESLDNTLEAFSKKNQDTNIFAMYNTSYQRNYEGPLDMDTSIELAESKIFKDFMDELSYKFFGPMHELINLLDLGYSVLRISSLLSIQYGTPILPSKVKHLIKFLEDKDIVKELKS